MAANSACQILFRKFLADKNSAANSAISGGLWVHWLRKGSTCLPTRYRYMYT